MSKPSEKQLLELWNIVEKFVKDNNISCGETIYQGEWVEENALEFIENCVNIVGLAEGK